MRVESTSLNPSPTSVRLTKVALLGTISLGLIVLFSGCAPRGAADPTVRPIAYDPAVIDAEITFNEKRVARDPSGAIGWALLSGAYLQRAKESDSLEYAMLAEEAARRSLKIRTRANATAALKLSHALVEQHRFLDSLDALELALKLSPNDEQILRTRCDLLLELGRYDDAKRQFAMLKEPLTDPGGLALSARFEELGGRHEQALAMYQKAAQLSRHNASMTAQEAAWFLVKYGNALLTANRASDAKQSFDEALQLYAKSYKALLGLGRANCVLGNIDAAIKNLVDCLAVADSLDARSLLVSLYDLNADSAHSQEQIKLAIASQSLSTPDVQIAIESGKLVSTIKGGKPLSVVDVMHSDGPGVLPHIHAPLPAKDGPGVKQSHTHNRQFAMFLADHKLNIETAVHLAEEDFRSRQDVLAFDTVGWSYLNAGLVPEAQIFLEKAASFGTDDARINFHLGKVYSVMGDERAMQQLQRATSGLLLPEQIQEIANLSASQGDGDDAKKQISYAYRSWSKAYVANDIPGMLALLAPEYVLKTLSKVFDLAGYTAILRSRRDPNIKILDSNTIILALSYVQNKATIHALERIDQAQTLAGKTTAVVHIHEYEDVWVKAAGGWKLTSTTTLVERTLRSPNDSASPPQIRQLLQSSARVSTTLYTR